MHGPCGILPEFAEHERFGIQFLHLSAELLQKGKRQFFDRIQAPSRGAETLPPADDGVLTGQNEFPELGIHLIDARKGMRANPGVIIVWPLMEMKPLVIGGAL